MPPKDIFEGVNDSLLPGSIKLINLWVNFLPLSFLPFLITLQPQNVKNIVTSIPTAEAPVAIIKAAIALSKSLDSKIIDTLLSGTRLLIASKSDSSADIRVIRSVSGLLSIWLVADISAPQLKYGDYCVLLAALNIIK